MDEAKIRRKADWLWWCCTVFFLIGGLVLLSYGLVHISWILFSVVYGLLMIGVGLFCIKNLHSITEGLIAEKRNEINRKSTKANSGES